ncbi:MAG: stage III sporulation protein AE [Lachnospiraceae bacterium]|jgi:stage III sporulation protein AE
MNELYRKILIGSILLFLWCTPKEAWAQEQQTEDGEAIVEAEELDEKGMLIARALLEDMEISKIQAEMDELLQENSFSLEETITAMLHGEMPFTRENAEKLIKEALFSQLSEQKKVMLNALLLIIVSALLTNFSSIFKNGQIGEISFYMVYMLLMALLIRSFGNVSAGIAASLEQMVSFMRILTPAYFLAIIAASGAGSASVFYEMVLILIYIIQVLLENLFLPGIHVYVLLQLVNYLHKEDFLSKMAELMKTIIEWGLKSCMSILIGWQVVQTMIAPALDSLKRTFLGKTAGAIPGIGDVMDGAFQVAVGTAVLVRNCLGAAAIVICLILFLTPMIRLGIITLLYKFLAAISQPVSDKRMVGCLSTVADGYVLLLRVLVTAEIVSIVTIAILATSFFH